MELKTTEQYEERIKDLEEELRQSTQFIDFLNVRLKETRSELDFQDVMMMKNDGLTVNRGSGDDNKTDRCG